MSEPMTRDELFAAALAKYPFRARRFPETQRMYEAAVITHVAERDLAAAHELRVGRVQAKWTSDDFDAFSRFMHAQPGPQTEPLPAGILIPMALMGRVEGRVTEAALLEVATRGLEGFMNMRRTDPAREMPVIFEVLLTDGTHCAGASSRADRVAIVTSLAQQLPVFGFTVLCDAFMHRVDEQTKTATKGDALIQHIGTRELRRMVCRPYKVKDGVTRFLEPMRDLDKRGPDIRSDPYAGVFASPAPGRPQ